MFLTLKKVRERGHYPRRLKGPKEAPLSGMEVELLWRRPNALSVALRGGLVSYVWQSLSDITEQLLAGHQSGSQWIHSQSYRTNAQGHQVDV